MVRERSQTHGDDGGARWPERPTVHLPNLTQRSGLPGDTARNRDDPNVLPRFAALSTVPAQMPFPRQQRPLPVATEAAMNGRDSAARSPRHLECAELPGRTSTKLKRIDPLAAFGLRTLGPIAAGAFSTVVRARRTGTGACGAEDGGIGDGNEHRDCLPPSTKGENPTHDGSDSNSRVTPEVAVKSFDKRRYTKGWMRNALKNELEVLTTLQPSMHEHIANLLEVHQTPQATCVLHTHAHVHACIGACLPRAASVLEGFIWRPHSRTSLQRPHMFLAHPKHARAPRMQIATECSCMGGSAHGYLSVSASHARKGVSSTLCPSRHGSHAVLQYCSGGSVHRHLRSLRHGHGFTEHFGAHLCAQLAHALAHLHAHGIVHRDVKPENVLYSDERRVSVKLCDFGFALLCANRLIKSCCGSPAYMAPELSTREPYVGPPVDTWALGCFAFEIINGISAFRAESVEALQLRVKRADHSPFRKSLGAGARKLIGKHLVPDVDRRASTEALAPLWQQLALDTTSQGGDPGEVPYRA